MIILLTGGSKCGKSRLAEALLQHLGQDGTPLVYLATMQVAGEEERQIVLRHQRARAGKGFKVFEQARDVHHLNFPGAALLLEDVPNLLANESFGGAGPEAAYQGLVHLAGQCRHLILVSNEVGSDGLPYEALTLDYIDQLGRLNQRLAALADCVAEVVAGLPILLKGSLPCT